CTGFVMPEVSGAGVCPFVHVDFIAGFRYAIAKTFGALPRPDNVSESVKGEIPEPLFEKVFGGHAPCFMVGPGDIGDALETFLEVLRNNGKFRATDFFSFLVVVELTDDSIGFPFPGPVDDSVNSDGIPVISWHTTKGPWTVIS